jgi:protein-tyrosine phosphatase
MEFMTVGAETPSRRWLKPINSRYGTWRGWVRSMLAQLEWRTGRLDQWIAQQRLGTSRRLVFVCLGNINRSAFASAVARSMGEPSISIGLSTTTGAPAFSQAVIQARLHGLDLRDHRATDFTDYAYAEGDLLFVMEVRHARQLVERGIPSDAIALLGAWSTPRRIHLHDPHTLSAEYFATCFSLIESAVRRVLDLRGGKR